MAPRTPSSTMVASIRSLSRRLIDLVEHAPDPNVPIRQTPGWALPQVMAHLVNITTRYAPELGDSDRLAADAADAAVLNEAELSTLRRHDLPEIVTALRAAVGSLPSGPTLDASGPVPYTGGVEVVPADLYGLMLGEFVVHGHDVAAALHRLWPIDRDDAVEIIRAITTILPAWVDPARTRGVSCVIELRLRGDRRYLWQFTDGSLVIDPPQPRPVDVTISASPTGLLLIRYGRLPPWRGVLTGQLFAWGHRPRLAFEATTFFHPP